MLVPVDNGLVVGVLRISDTRTILITHATEVVGDITRFLFPTHEIRVHQKAGPCCRCTLALFAKELLCIMISASMGVE